MTRALVFRTPRRLLWLERGLLFGWSEVLHRWCRIPAHVGARIGGDVLTPDAVLEVVAEKGTPWFPRVEAGAWLPCTQCGQVSGERRTYLGVRPFCSSRCMETYIHASPLVDSQSRRA